MNKVRVPLFFTKYKLTTGRVIMHMKKILASCSAAETHVSPVWLPDSGGRRQQSVVLPSCGRQSSGQ